MTTPRPQKASHSQPKRPASTVVTLGPDHHKPWWWSEVDHENLPCKLNYTRLVYKGKTSRDLSFLELPVFFVKVLRFLLTQKSESVDYVFTFECDLVGWAIAFWQTVLPLKRPKHVILQFIMRELQPDLRSRIKYALMRFLLSSVHRVVCSSTQEVKYYEKVFGWDAGKLVFAPFHTSSMFLDYPADISDDVVIAAGRSFRDYDTLVEAVSGSDIKVLIVGGSGCKTRYTQHANVTVMENIPQDELTQKLSRASIVVLPLEDRQISTGQTILLQAMAMGKPVVATRTAGTIDYIKSGETGFLVDPGNSRHMRTAIETLYNDHELCARIGREAKRIVSEQHLPRHYAQDIAKKIAR